MAGFPHIQWSRTWVVPHLPGGPASSSSFQIGPVHGNRSQGAFDLEGRQLCDLRKEREAQVKRKHESFEEEREEKRRRCEDEALQSAKSMERGLVLRFDEVPASLKWRDLREGLTPYGFCGYVRVKDGHALVQMREEQGVFAVMGCAKEEG
ncbi:unnamed protein product [Durusdinium trenchii]|uniref:Uncharacterized protein n=1 Tax=Durusdinium trenchii TaxID=1381693 RepID=A0ABP0SAA2_9DINO